MNIKKLYYYLFYKFYQFFKALESTALLKAKAAIILMALEIWLLFSINNYFEFFFYHHSKLNFFSFRILIPLSIVIIIKWVAFIKDDRWKNYFKEFDQWPKEKNKIGSWIVFFIVILCFANFIFSYFLNPPPGGARW